MKKLLSIIIAMIMIVLLTGCSNTTDEKPNDSNVQSTASQRNTDNQTKEMNNESNNGKVIESSISSSVTDSITFAAITDDSKLWMWGENCCGALGDETTKDASTPKVIMEDVAKIQTNGKVTAAIKKDDSLWMWGDNSFGQIGNGGKGEIVNDLTIQSSPEQILENVESVFICDNYILAIKKDSSLWSWGANDSGQLGNAGVGDGSFTKSTSEGNTKCAMQTTPTEILSDVSSVTVSVGSNAAIKKDGSLWVWGENGHGQLGSGEMKEISKGTYGYLNENTPVKILDNVKSVALEDHVSAVLQNDGTLWLWGINDDGQVGNGTTKDVATPQKILNDVKEVKLDGYGNRVAAIKEDNSLWMWGDNFCGSLGTGTTDNVLSPTKIMDDVSSVELNNYSLNGSTAAITNSHELWMWGDNESGIIGKQTGKEQITPVKVLDQVKQVAFSQSKYVAAVQNDGKLVLWGKDKKEIVSTSSKANDYEMLDVMNDVDRILRVSLDSIAVLDNNGSIWVCGRNDNYHLGIGEVKRTDTPVRVEFLPVEGSTGDNEDKSTDQRTDANDSDRNEKALEKAKSYVEAMALSYDGVIEHLEMIGFTSDEAKYGADNCGADWNEQAARKAAVAKKIHTYSKDEMIEILENNGFTHEQAVYGAEQNGFE